MAKIGSFQLCLLSMALFGLSYPGPAHPASCSYQTDAPVPPAKTPVPPVAIKVAGTPNPIVLSPDGRWLATVSAASGYLRLYRVSDGRLLITIKEVCGEVSFSPDGRLLGYIHYPDEERTLYNSIRVLAVPSGRPVFRVSAKGHRGSFGPGYGRFDTFAFIPGHRQILASAPDLFWIAYPSGRTVAYRRLQPGPGFVYNLGFSNDGRWRVMQQFQTETAYQTLSLYNARTRRRVRRWSAPQSWIAGHTGGVPSIWPHILAWGLAIDRLPDRWDLRLLKTYGRRVLVDSDTQTPLIVGSTQKDRLAVAYHDPSGATYVDIWQIRPLHRLAHLRDSHPNLCSVAISGDGEVIAAGSAGGFVRIWRLHQ